MCFCKTRQSKVLKAKRDIVVYKIGVEANKAIFTPYFMTNFSYIAGIKNTTNPNFDISHIKEGFHGYKYSFNHYCCYSSMRCYTKKY